MSLSQNEDYKAGRGNQRTVWTDVNSREYKKGEADRRFAEQHPLVGLPQWPSQSGRSSFPVSARPASYDYGTGSGSSVGRKFVKLIAFVFLVFVGYAVYESQNGNKQPHATQRPPQYQSAPQAPPAAAPRANKQNAQHIPTPAETTQKTIDEDHPHPWSDLSASASVQPADNTQAERLEEQALTQQALAGGSRDSCYQDMQQLEADIMQHKDVPPTEAPETLKWCKESAGYGDLVSMLIIGSIYEYGAGVPRDAQEAIAWNRRALAGSATSRPEIASRAREALQRLGAQ